MSKVLKTPVMLLMLIAIFSMAIGGSAYASKDSKSNSIRYKSSISVSAAVTMIVEGLNLNIDNIRFIKQPMASDYYTKVKDNASYAEHFIIAQFNGLGLPKDIDPNSKVTREQFSYWLFGALSHKGSYAWIDIYHSFADAEQVTNVYRDSIQKLLISKIATLDSKQKFHPRSNITRTEAATMINRTLKFIKTTPPVTPPETAVLSDAHLATDKETDSVTRVTLSVTAPHRGYGLEITGIQFVKGEAVIQYRAIQPDPDMMYPQALAKITAVTYIPSGFKAILGQEQPIAPFPGK
ncbi:S-layer homology domain-containing protein [Cohnella herbarum]|uniref:S-layer homology domain-containing protein n=1 Tax=Cohnella herbarum TaxID=2728023 RepID=A0A7Z2VIM3_9BACL|nr:S-layer homology domain-containing protein [Cohnella herbarum]QJD83549.1 S-layer homology domain-containing protein [Cohnella herbarum]